jgi:hypothetical protein
MANGRHASFEFSSGTAFFTRCVGNCRHDTTVLSRPAGANEAQKTTTADLEVAGDAVAGSRFRITCARRARLRDECQLCLVIVYDGATPDEVAAR